jgi:predicted AAA+ superfamily ATPase
VVIDSWDAAFRSELQRGDRNVVHELRDWRNKLAHHAPISTEDAYRALDSIERLLVAIDAREATEVGRSKDDLMRLRYEEQARRAAAAITRVESTDGAAVSGLRPWREVVQPHDDVVAGRFNLAEFAADLYQVHAGEGRAEYSDPVEFFRRTYLTAGLRTLLAQAVERVTGAGGAPVVDLQTTFGGGKTHSMIALYHLLSGIPLPSFPQEVQELVAAGGVISLPDVRRAVLVGNQLKPGQPEQHGDIEIRTMWGELAWQLGGAEGFALVAESDRNATNPGDALRLLLRQYSPCLILVDEWVAYARQLYRTGELPAGSFDTHFSFAQALTEAARATDGALLVVSIPASGDGSELGSDIEVGGADGQAALRRLRSIVGRMESSWRPAQMEEGFEIVRRRLFQPIEPARITDRDATARLFGDLYRKQAAEFPTECREAAYEQRIRAAYPIHPELFARLYDDWSTLERFQRTRGVLRLIASVMQAL